jgi:hydrogenase expression/formation protein HypE
MTERGKIDRDFFADTIAPNLGADREDVALGPHHGVDFGVLAVGDRRLLCATDPLSVLPGLGFERAARFALGVVLADVAVAGVAPTHLAPAFALPTEMEDAEFARLWGAMDAELRELGTAVLTGHTARYDGAAFPWVGAATAMAVAEPGTFVRPDGARPGDRLLVTTGPGVEAAALFAALYPDEVPLDRATTEAAAALLPETDHVRAAPAAADAAPVTAMHDATEGGLHGALHELAAASGVALEFDPAAVPFPEPTRAVAEALSFDPWSATSSGCLLVTVRPDGVDDALAALRDAGLDAAAVGRVTDGSGVSADGEPVPEPDGDASWPVYAELSGAE